MTAPDTNSSPSPLPALTRGTTKGSLNPRAEATVSTGSTQENMAPKRIIFPSRGATGSRAKWWPRGVSSSSLSRAFCRKEAVHQGGRQRLHWVGWLSPRECTNQLSELSEGVPDGLGLGGLQRLGEEVLRHSQLQQLEGDEE